MHLVARLGKTQTHRHLPEIYQRLRRLAVYYDDDENLFSSTRQRIQALIGELFLDYDKPVAFTFSTTGPALMDAYAFNPYAIVRAGYARFQEKMKRRVRFIRFSTLEHLYMMAEASVRHRCAAAEEELYTARRKALWTDLERLTLRRQHLRMNIEALGEALKTIGAPTENPTYLQKKTAPDLHLA